MPQIQLESYCHDGESESQVIKRLRGDAEIEKSNVLSNRDAVRIFDITPAIQVIGKKVILRWSYKQYPLAT